MKSTRFRQWQKNAALCLWPRKIFYGAVRVSITLGMPDNRMRDIDGAIKPLLDILVSEGIIADDSHEFVKKVEIELGDGFIGARVTVIPLTQGDGML